MIEILMARAAFLNRAAWTETAADYVAANGIDMEAVNAHAGILTVINCEFFGNGHFDFAGEEDGKPAVVIEVYGDDDETTVDLCAWPVDEPETFATILGADALGMARVVNPATWAFGGVLNVHRTPLRWLQAGCQGCCVLDHRFICVWMRDVSGPIMTEGVEHARQLDAMLNPPRFDKSRILFPRGAERRVA